MLMLQKSQQLSLLAVAALLTNAFIWGVAWWPFRLLAQNGLHSLWATAMMYSLITIALWLWYRITARSSSIVTSNSANPNIKTNPKTKEKWLLLALLIAVGLTNCAFNWAVTIGEVVRVVLLFYLMPIWTLLFARLFLGESLTGSAWLRIALCVAGAILVLAPKELPISQITLPAPSSLADWLGISGGIGFAATNVALRACAVAGISTQRISLSMFGGGALLPALLAMALTANATIAAVPDPSIVWIAILLVLSVGFLLSNLALQYGAARLPASIIAAVMPSEVVFASVSAVLIAGEVFTVRLLVGGGLILMAALLSIFHHQKQ